MRCRYVATEQGAAETQPGDAGLEQMIRLPVLTELNVTNYGLFPGDPRGSGIEWTFRPGVSLIAGINGLGKTTLLMMILRSFTGPYDLTGDGAPQTLSVVIPESPVQLRSRGISFFAQRVADAANSAEATLSALIGDRYLTITRRLDDLSLKSCELDRAPVDLPVIKAEREAAFQSLLAELMDLGSFVDVLLILHHVILFHENRPGALWDTNAQRQVLRALFLDKRDATRVAELERLAQSADSQARNINTRLTATENDLREARRREAGSEGVVVQIEAEQRLLDAELVEAARLDGVIAQLDADRQQARLEHERAKVEREEATGAIERWKYTALLRLFPTMDDAARLIASRIMTQNRCLVCNAEADARRLELERLIEQGCCPVCGAEPAKQDKVIARHEFEQAKLDQARERAELARREEDTKDGQLRRLAAEYERSVERLSQVRRSIEERKRKDRRLRSQLPQTTTSKQYESALKTLRTQLLEWGGKRATYLRELRTLLTSKENLITAQSTELMETFGRLTHELLAEEARLAQVSAEPRYTQAPGPSSERLKVPAYAAEMTAADRPAYVRRNDPADVSESQRELLDLAFRLALVKVATRSSACTFVMETPEASLDGLAMNRVGCALAAFAASNDNRLVVTCNLSNAGIITALFGGPSSDDTEVDDRYRRVLNLLRVAAPNQALTRDKEGYSGLLDQAIVGLRP